MCFAFVAKDDVRSVADVDDIVTGTCDDGIHAGLQGDRVVSTVTEVDRFDEVEITVGIESSLSIVAENRVGARACCDLITALSADNGIDACCQVDRICGSACEFGAFDADQFSGRGVQNQLAVVAENDSTGSACVAGDVDIVTSNSADNNVDANADVDVVDATMNNAAAIFDRFDRNQTTGDIQLTFVTEHNVVALTDGDNICPRTSQNAVDAIRHIDSVVCTRSECLRRHELQTAVGQQFRLAVVAQNRIHAGCCRDDIHTLSSNHGVRAAGKRNGVISAVRFVDRFNRLQVATGKEDRLAVVAQNRVGSGTCGDLITALSADDSIRASGQSNRVVCSAGKLCAFDAQQSSGCCVDDHLAVVAQHNATSCSRRAVDGDTVFVRSTGNHVVATANSDRIFAADQTVQAFDDCLAGIRAGRVNFSLAFVTKDEVRSRSNADDVVTESSDNAVGAVGQRNRVVAAVAEVC